MNKRLRGMIGFGWARRAVLACVLGLVLAALWSDAAPAEEKYFYDIAVIDSVADDGDGKIRLAWSLKASEFQAREDPGSPIKICPRWVWDKNPFSYQYIKCFTSELSGETDLVWDAKTENIPGTSAVTFEVELAVHYDDRPGMPIYGTPANDPDVAKVTVKRP